MSRINDILKEKCPDGVEYKSIGSLITRVRTKGKTCKDATQVYVVSNTMGIVRSEDYHNNEVHSEDTSNYTVIKQGMFAYNPARLNIGSLGVLKKKETGLVSPMYVVFSVDENIVLQEYMLLNLKSSFVKNKIESLKEEGARFRFDYERWDKIEIPVPPIEVQQEIVRILDKFAELEEGLQAELDARKKQYEHFRDEILDLPETPCVPLSKLTLKVEGIDWKKCDSTKKYIDLSSVDRETHAIISDDVLKISAENAPSRAKQIVKENDILFGGTRPMLKRYCIVSAEYDEQVCSTGYCVLRVDNKIAITNFVYHYLGTSEFYRYVEANQQGASYPAIGDTVLKAYEIPVPSFEEQERIVAVLDCFKVLCNDTFAGLPAEIAARHKQYEYYRDKLLTFKRKEV